MNNNFSIVARTSGLFELNNFIILNTDKFADITQLDNANIGFPQGTENDYFWYYLSNAYSLSPDKVNLINIPIPDMKKAMLSGQLDAIIIYTPLHTQILEGWHKPVKIYNQEAFYNTNWLLIADNELIQTRPDTVSNYLKALLDAQVYFTNNKAQVAQWHTEIIDLPESLILESYNYGDFTLNLTESLLLQLSIQAKWKMNEVKLNHPVNVRSYLDPSFLSVLEPNSVKLLE